MKTLITFLLFIPGLLLSQNHVVLQDSGLIRGVVKIASTEATLPRATVTLKNTTDSNIVFVDTTDIDGKYAFSQLVIGEYRLQISYIGLHTVIYNAVKINKDHLLIELPITYMNNNEVELKEIEIQAPQGYIEQKIDKTVVNVKALLSNTGISALDVLNNSPGIELNDGIINLRGKSGVTIYIDDKPTFLSGKDLTIFLQSMPSSALDKIEIMPNPPAKYRAAGTGGVINVKTLKPINDGVNTNVSLSYGHGKFSKINNSGIFNYKQNKFSLYGLVGYSSNNDFSYVDRNRDFSMINESNILMQQFNREENSTKNAIYKLGIDYSFNKSTTIGFTINGSKVRYKEKGDYIVNFRHNSNIDSILTTVSTMGRDIDKLSTNFNLNQKLRNDGEININFDYLNYKNLTDQTLLGNTKSPDGTSLDTYSLFSNNPFVAEIRNGKLDYDKKIREGTLSVGAQITYSSRNSDGYYSDDINQNNFIDSLNNTFKYNEGNYSVYFNYMRKFKKLLVQTGIRVEHTRISSYQENALLSTGKSNKNNFLDYLPTMFLSYRFNEQGIRSVGLSLGRSIRRPNYSDLNYSSFIFDRYFSNRGNPNLKPEYSIKAEFTYVHNKSLFSGITFNRINNMILRSYILDGFSLIQAPINISKAYSYSVYLNYSTSLFTWLSANISGDYSINNFHGSMVNPNSIGGFVDTFRGTVSSQIKLFKDCSIELSGSYRTLFSGGQGVNLPIGKLNTTFQTKILKKQGTIGLTVNDLFQTWNTKREIYLKNAVVNSSMTNDTRYGLVTFTYKIGSSVLTKARKTGMQTEERRVN